ncbi:hypothetical protein ENBRE01_3123 [Enteropsectra breve]|nr:hypothetical protein ENBRE01_3123 [Enteropsectra breve]
MLTCRLNTNGTELVEKLANSLNIQYLPSLCVDVCLNVGLGDNKVCFASEKLFRSLQIVPNYKLLFSADAKNVQKYYCRINRADKLSFNATKNYMKINAYCNFEERNRRVPQIQVFCAKCSFFNAIQLT